MYFGICQLNLLDEALMEEKINHIYQPLRSGRIWHNVNF